MVWLARQSRATSPRQTAAEVPTDAALVAAAQADPRAFLALYERYADRIYGYCHARLGSREAAEDATSEVFTKALAAIGRYQDACFAAWLFRIAHNVVADTYRRRPVAPLDIALDRPDPARGPDLVRAVRACADELSRLLNHRPAADRAAAATRILP